ncbi:microfibril-associated glycoprotein 4-like [Uranotaenia lowii]|uniref:microfibril-associated glycoprotein 4-like n=1 Tax=Uranotaenia lowii TaxID=190385 RepID=UPI0024788DBB|nr:microfibril-associated glycoprotein 4-like [Uranotaenia lowii]
MILLLMFLAVVTSQDVLPRSCLDIQSASGVYEIHPEYGFGKPIDVYCEQTFEDGGWIVIQNRFNGSVHFYRGWKDYENGFGDWRGEFWLGLNSIHRITYSQPYELLIQLGDESDKISYARYTYFVISGPEDSYTLKHLGKYSGTTGDSLNPHKNYPFSTMDRDNRKTKCKNHKKNCAVEFQGAWWYDCCHYSNLNGLYLVGKQKEYATSICWMTFKGYYYGFKTSRMMIRPKASTTK